MTATPLELDLSRRESRRKAGPKLAARLMAFLAGNKCWMTRAQIFECQILNLNENKTPSISRETSNRLCRLAHEKSNARIISGQKGYKLRRDATVEEGRDALCAMKKQIDAMTRQYLTLNAALHRDVNRKPA